MWLTSLSYIWEFTQVIGLTPFLYFYNNGRIRIFQDGIFHKKVASFLCKWEKRESFYKFTLTVPALCDMLYLLGWSVGLPCFCFYVINGK